MKSKYFVLILVAVVSTWIIARLSARGHLYSLESALRQAREEINILNCMLNQFQYQ